MKTFRDLDKAFPDSSVLWKDCSGHKFYTEFSCTTSWATFTRQMFSRYIISYKNKKFSNILVRASSFVSDMTKTSTFPIIWLANRSNLFLRELMFKWAIMTLFKVSCLITLKKLFSETSFGQLFKPDANSRWDLYSVGKSLTQLNSSEIPKDDRK